ncbi:MAG: universal stress protein [Myxococcales bacterium]|nr:universal stress protein [Myxococcales bacterium]
MLEWGMAHVAHKLKGSLEGALAGGGDPATSPLYVFGPFLKLLVVAGVSHVTFGASVWLAVITVITVSAMYRLVMIWVTDGSGGSGLSEEEFGPWAVKINAGITVVEYTLTFLVSMTALVTFLADRLALLDRRLLGLPMRTLVAIGLSVLTGYVVNRGPRVAARAFGPATAAILLLLWVMIGTTIYRRGFHLPAIHGQAFTPRLLPFTLGGYARILALMTGIEIFANLVAAYEGPARRRSAKAFGSLVIVMGTTTLTMLIVGPAILALSNPLDPNVSVFTQTMDQLLPGPLSYLGTLIGIAVLLSAAAASAQGVQNLSLGLRYRHYIPGYLGQKNRFDVADRPVWLQVAICVLCLLVFGTREETYLALYAAGVFILLSLTGWAAVKRLVRELRRAPSLSLVAMLSGTGLASTLTTGATLVIFEERFREGAWAYLLMIPALYFGFGWFRWRLGAPPAVEDRLGRLLAALPGSPVVRGLEADVALRHVLVPLDRRPTAEFSLAIAQAIARHYGARVTLLSVLHPSRTLADEAEARAYLSDVADQLGAAGVETAVVTLRGKPADEIGAFARQASVDMILLTTDGRGRWQRWLQASATAEVIHQTTPPLIVLRPTDDWQSVRTRFARLLVALDGSEIAEQVLPYAREFALRFRSEVLLLSVPEGSDSDEAPANLRSYLDRLRLQLSSEGVQVRALVEGSAPAHTILRVAETNGADLIMMVSHGRGGVARQAHVPVGSVTDRVVQEACRPVFLVSATPPSAERPGHTAGATRP